MVDLNPNTKFEFNAHEEGAILSVLITPESTGYHELMDIGMLHSTLLELNYIFLLVFSQPQLNHNSTQPNITLSWVRHENDFAHHPTPHPTPPPHTNSMLAISQLLLT